MMLAPTFATFAITLNGTPVLPRARAAVVGGRVLLPVRALGDALGAAVAYDAAARRIVVRRGARAATLPASGVRIVGGRAYAPLRAVATAFGFGVAYDGAARTVALDDGARSHAVASGDTPQRAALPPPPVRPSPGSSIVTTPAAGASVHEPYPSISARFAGVAAIDPSSLSVRLDDRDVTSDAAVIGDQVAYTPRTALASGRHDVRVDARDAGGAPLSASWSFDDSFAFAPPPPPSPPAIRAVYLDRWVSPGTNAFDVYVRGVPGLNGFVEVEGIRAFFPLTVYTYDAYVAHVIVPPAMYQPFAHVAARINLPNGTVQTIVLPQTIGLFTPRAGGDAKPTPTATPTATPSPAVHRTPVPRRPLGAPAAVSPKPRPSPSP